MNYDWVGDLGFGFWLLVGWLWLKHTRDYVLPRRQAELAAQPDLAWNRRKQADLEEARRKTARTMRWLVVIGLGYVGLHIAFDLALWLLSR